ncbi:AAA family ATPase [Peribacillus sp. S4]|uniref:AAA family ATPase n=1 Tax=Peribacillus sp. S4 TaxID=3384451 RepID=UPI0039895AB0
MKILKMKLGNYKSIENSGLLDLNSRINIFAGKNNTGKTALIEALYYASNAVLQDSLPNALSNISYLEFEITVDDTEINILNRGMQPGYFISEANKFRINMSFVNLEYSCINKVEVFNENRYLPLYTNQSEKEPNPSYLFNSIQGGGTTFAGRPEAINNIIYLLKNRLVFVSGARYVPKEESTHVQNSLNIDGNNLNTFLFTLHNNDERAFDQILHVFKKIFNDITSISTPINEGNVTSISLYFEGNPQPIPLSSCGSGFTHVLIIL